MIMKVVFENGEWFIGNRDWKQWMNESKDCHHFIIIEGTDRFRKLAGKEVAVHLSKPMYFELNYKDTR
jgi:hypothetical protein